jgi:hypothetical protein
VSQTRLRIFAKGNVDVRDTLLFSKVGGVIQWNGINTLIRARFPGWVAQVKHETLARSDLLVESRGEIPKDLAAQALPLGAFPLESQYRSELLSWPADVVVLSVQPDVTNGLLRHRQLGYPFFGADSHEWTAEQRAWAKQHFAPAPYLTPAESAAQLTQVVKALQEKNPTTRVLIFNLSPFVPLEQVHCFRGIDEPLSVRSRRFGLALVGLSRELGVSVVDVDAVLAREGAAALKVDFLHLTGRGYQLIAEEVVRILEELGCFDG